MIKLTSILREVQALKPGSHIDWSREDEKYVAEELHNIIDDLNKRYAGKLNGYAPEILAFDEYHEYCPIGFDIELSHKTKKVTLEICLQNADFTSRKFWETVEEELVSTLEGYTIQVDEFSNYEKKQLARKRKFYLTNLQ